VDELVESIGSTIYKANRVSRQRNPDQGYSGNRDASLRLFKSVLKEEEKFSYDEEFVWGPYWISI
jgi:hypothetical protein